MNEILPFPGNAFMYSGDNLAAFLSFFFFGFRQLALRLSQCLLFLAEKPGVSNVFTSRKGGERVKANINADSLVIFRQRSWLPFAGEHDIPFASRRTLNGTGFYVSFYRPMENNLDIAYFRKAQDVTVKTKTALRKGETIISSLATEARIPRFFARFNPAEKGFKGKVNTDSDILQDLRMYAGKGRTLFFEDRKTGCLSMVVDALLLFLPCFFAFSEKMVEQPTALFKPLVHYVNLFFSWVNPVFESFKHSVFTRLNYTTSNEKIQAAFHPLTEVRGIPGGDL